MNYQRISLMCTNFIAEVVGSWKFIAAQSFVLVLWILFHDHGAYVFDPYPFILLNLIVSIQAAHMGSILLMTTRRQAILDNRRDIEYLRILMKFSKADKSSKV